jgi:hypothetical protein
MNLVLLLLQDLLLSTFSTLQATGTTHLCPACCDVLALVLAFLVFESLLTFGIFSIRADVNWRMGVYAPPHRGIYLRSPALLFRCHKLFYPYQRGAKRELWQRPQCDLP